MVFSRHLLFARFCHLRGKPPSRAQICAHCGAYTVRCSLNCAPISLNWRITCKWNRWVNALNLLSRPRFYSQIADRAKCKLGQLNEACSVLQECSHVWLAWTMSHILNVHKCLYKRYFMACTEKMVHLYLKNNV